MNGESWLTAAWVALIGSGLYHGLNPAMGWPLAVSAGLFERRPGALAAALGSLSAGHLLAMLALLLPLAGLLTLARWERSIRIVAACVVLAYGLARALRVRHPRVLARIPPARLGLWSFAVALAHGASLMLVPIYLGLCRSADTDAGHRAAGTLMSGDLATALVVAVAHTAAMLAAAASCAWITYRYVGLAALRKAWWNTDALWSASLIAVGGISLATAL